MTQMMYEVLKQQKGKALLEEVHWISMPGTAAQCVSSLVWSPGEIHSGSQRNS